MCILVFWLFGRLFCSKNQQLTESANVLIIFAMVNRTIQASATMTTIEPIIADAANDHPSTREASSATAEAFD
jgi:hypothetical protein